MDLPMEKWTEEHFEKYYANDMPEVQREKFEADMARNPELAAQFKEFTNLIAGVKQVFERKSIKKQIKKIHYSMVISKETATIVNKKLRRITFQSLAAAASVAIIIAVTGLYFAVNLRQASKDSYLELRNEVQGISSAQESMKKAIASNQRKYIPYTGSCFAISSDGLLATNHHVVRNIDSVWLANFQDTLVRYKASVVYRNRETDIALLQIDDPSFTGFGKLPFSWPNSSADIAEYVFILGYSKQDIVFGEGSVSSISGYYDDTTSYQISIPVNPGNSGSPMFDGNGNFLGLISGKNTHKDGVGFAVKSEYILQAVQELSENFNTEFNVQHYRNRLVGKSRTEQVKILRPIVFKVEIEK